MFMKSYTEKESREVKPPLENDYVCVSCAGKLGGKLDRRLPKKWAFATCDICGKKNEVTTPKEFIWR
jgi:transcription elongation factor Elf1